MEKTNFNKGITGALRHTRQFKKGFSIVVVLTIFSAIANGSIPWITGKFFDSLINISESGTVGNFPLWATLLMTWAIVQFLANNFDWIADRLMRRLETKVRIFIQSNSIKYLLRLPISFYKNEHIQDVFQKISYASWRISAMLGRIFDIAPQLLSILVGISLSYLINAKLASILVIAVIVYAILLLKILKPIARYDHQAHEIWNGAWDESVSYVTQIDSIKQSASEDYHDDLISEKFDKDSYSIWNKVEMIWSNVGSFQRLIIFLTQLSIFTLSVYLIINGEITVGDLIAINGYAAMFLGPFVTLGYSWQTFQNGLTSSANLEEIFHNQPEIYNPKNAVTKEINGKVVFDNVSFGYQDLDKDEKVLKNINFEVEHGQVVALVGESGAGKSTLVSLISAYYFPQEGNVSIDDNKTSEYNLISLRKQISVVPQEISLFNDTIETNIKYGSFDATREQVINACKKAHIYDYIETLPNKFETIVGERGVKLSVGQKQRIAIARAILQNPKILILDEPTSALDAITEKKITESLDLLMKGRTTFIIAHRLSTVRKADKIFVFDKGKIAESGTHEELLKKEGGYYRKLHDYQIGLY